MATTPDKSAATAAPRRPSITEKLIGSGKEFMSGFYKSVEKDEMMGGQGFSDPIDDMMPGVFDASRRRRSSQSEDPNAPRRASITERVAGMQVTMITQNTN